MDNVNVLARTRTASVGEDEGGPNDESRMTGKKMMLFGKIDARVVAACAG